MKLYYTYELIDSRNNNVFYVGKGTGNRMYTHYNRIIKNNKNIKNTKLQNKICSIYKNNGFIIYNKIDAISEENAFILEKLLISEHKTNGIDLCNLTEGGEGISGHTFKHTIETKNKISKLLKNKPKTDEHKNNIKKAKKNNINNTKYWDGKKFSDEHKEKLSKSAKKRLPVSDETKQKISNNSKNKLNKGKTHIEIYGKEKAENMCKLNKLKHLNKKASDETKQKMSNTQKELKTNTYIIEENNIINEEKITIKELAVRYNLSVYYIRNIINNNLTYNNIKIRKK